MVAILQSTDELVCQLGADLKKLRLLQAVDRRSLALRAGVSLNAIKRLENGEGATISTLVKVLRSLDRLDWLTTLAPKITVNPLYMPRGHAERQRAPRRVKKSAE
jgi:transcriptional regulator with XRE-family HTH domain